jgi:hypothetical protein
MRFGCTSQFIGAISQLLTNALLKFALIPPAGYAFYSRWSLGGIMHKWGSAALCVALGGCASSSTDISPAYISPVTYQSYTCQQLALEAQAVSTRAATLSGVQDSQRTKDGVATAAAIVIFWPAAFFAGGDKQTAAELAQMKGQMVAIEQASIAKKCNIQFQGKPAGN